MSAIHDVFDDIRYAARQLWRSPFFTLTATLSVATGIVVAVGAFTVLNATLFKPLPVSKADQIYHVYTADFDGNERPYGRSSYADYHDFARTGAFSQLAATTWSRIPVTTADAEPSMNYVSFVSPNYFAVLGLQPAYGRSLNQDAQSEIVLSYAFWKHTLRGDISVLGSTIRIGFTPVTIVGIAPESFVGLGFGPPLVGWTHAAVLTSTASNLHVIRDVPGRRADEKQPIGEKTALTDRRDRRFDVFGRLHDGQSAVSAAAQLNAIAKGLEKVDPDAWRTKAGNARLVSLLTQKESNAPPGQRGELLMGVAAGSMLVLFILLLACTNVAALLLGRAVGRQHEIAVRLALGATRRRLIRQLLTESFLLAIVGGTISLFAVMWVAAIVRSRGLADMFDLRMDWRVLLVALVTSFACAILFGLAPARQSLKVDTRSGLSGSTMSRNRNRLRGSLIAAQVAVSCVMILLASSAVRGVRAFVSADPGIPLTGLVTMRGDWEVFPDDSVRNAEYMKSVLDIARATPGVQSISTTALLPLGHVYMDSKAELPDHTVIYPDMNQVSVSYFETIGLKAIQGRVFDRRDRATANVVVVNSAFAQKYGHAMVGQFLKINKKSMQIVGVVADIDYHDSKEAVAPLVYTPVETRESWSHPAVLLKVSAGDERSVSTIIRAAIRQRYSDVVAPTIEPLVTTIARDTKPQQLAGRAALGAGAIELALSAIGLYGLLMFALSARRREIGVRLAIGSSPQQASWAILRDGLKYAAIGGAIGTVLCVPASMAAANAMPGVEAADPVPFIAAILAVVSAVTVAAFMPARRAALVDPMDALRHE